MKEVLKINRKEILNNAVKESELSDLKQHADKMIRGFENFNNYTSIRAIWELVQNACDLSEECEVVIDYSKDNFSFTHNGNLFTTKALISLIKQVSGKYGEESDLVEIGKYGTGFLTTHAFGRKFSINSVLEANGAFFKIDDFIIDRSPKEWKALSENIRIQKENVYKLIENGVILSEPLNKTTFTYFPQTEQEFKSIEESYEGLEDYVPLVLTINDRLKQVTIINTENKKIKFERLEKNQISCSQGVELFKTRIAKNNIEEVIFSIIDNDNKLEVILPINEALELFEFSENIARLFLYYPLVGSEDFGVNFIINCSNFLPTEPRDGIHLMSSKDQVKDQEEENRRIIELASELIFTFLKSNTLDVSNPLLYGKINFKRNTENNLLNGYFENIQNLWTNEFKSLPIVETKNGFKPVEEICFFKAELFLNPDFFDHIYLIASIFYDNLPVKSKIEQWSTFVNDWKNESVRFIAHEDLVLLISKEDLSKFDLSCLKNYYMCLIEQGRINLFSEHELLPNLSGKFHFLPYMLNQKDLNPTLIEIGNVLIPDSIERIVHDDFTFNFNFEKFNRRDFSNSVKTMLDELQILDCICIPFEVNFDYYNTENINKYDTLNYDFFINLINFCKINSTIKSQSKPSNLIKILCKYYLLDDTLIQIPNLKEQDENLDIRSTRKILIQVFFNLLQNHNEEWVANNISLILDIANCNEESLKDVYSKSIIYPNQMNQLKSINDLKRDIDVSEEIVKLYNTVTKDEIKAHLIYRQFNNYVNEDRFVTNKYLTSQIEDAFFDFDISNINEHPFKVEMLNIISKLKEKHYSELFPRLDDKKAKLMLDIVTNDNTKDDIFSLVTLQEDQLKKLGKLVQEDNFDAILNTANAILQMQVESKADFRHKYEIGTNIERLIREKLSLELKDRVSFSREESLETSDIQGGQDIVVFLDGSPIYFIEVKSRWKSDNSVSMSKLQLQRAVEENERYALCSVDITKYKGQIDRYNLSIKEILPLTKFVTNIGSSIKPLIEDNLTAEKNQNESIHLIDYRGIIPQEIIKMGDDFSKFINTLSKKINNIGKE